MMTLFGSRSGLANSFGLKAIVLVILVLMFLLPQGLILDLVNQRGRAQAEAIGSMYLPMGGNPAIAGPFISVPAQFQELDEKGLSVLRQRLVYFPASSSHFRVKARVSELQRGIYKAPQLTVESAIQASFDLAQAVQGHDQARSYDWGKARLFLAIPDARLLADEARAGLTAAKMLPLRGDSSPIPGYERSLAIDVANLGAAVTQPFTVSIDLLLRGGGQLSFLPGGGSSRVSLESAWPAPSFQGFVLPRERQLNDSGFSAEWYLPESVQPLPGAFAGEGAFGRLSGQDFGVAFIQPVDTYRKAYRAAKYAFLFTVIPFCVLFLFEVFAALRLHPIQYCLIGFVNMVFYLLLLSIAEHWGFGPAYAGAALATSLAVGFYFRAISGNHPAWWAGIVSMAGLYGLLYAILLSEDYALLIGSIGLFVAGAGIMWAIRKVDWYAPGKAVDRSSN